MAYPLPLPAGKVVAVHLNYRSRAAERGRTPDAPSYFLQAASSVSGAGDAITRPDGCQLLTFEGEIALVIGKTARGVAPQDAWEHVGWVTAANDFGVHDLRYADAGANVRSKSGDGYTPMGPRLLDARSVNPAELAVRTWLDGELVQDGAPEELIFPLPFLVADLARLSTLHPGDVILCGTPAGARPVEPGSTVEVEVSAPGLSTGRLVTPVRQSSADLPPWGAMPRVDDAARLAAGGRPAVPPGAALPIDWQQRLSRLSTATLAAQLRRRGHDTVTMDGIRPLRPGARMTGVARTLRYLPARPDHLAERTSGLNAQKRLIDSIGPGEVIVMDARRDPTAGTVGDILALRAQVRGAAGIVTDGAVRDSAAVAALDIPTFGAAAHPAVLGRRHLPWDIDVDIACGGVLVRPGDFVAGDDDGVVVIPPQLLGEVIEDAEEQERQERFITEQVSAGAGIEGLYPLGPYWKRQYAAWHATSQSREENHA